MNKINYQKELDKLIDNLEERVPTLLLHSCCAPCSSYTLEYLAQFFDITVYYYNPNISPSAEFNKRLAEQQKLIDAMPTPHRVKLVAGEYDYSEFLDIARGYEHCPEGGDRCHRCYRLRLEKTAKLAKEQGFDYFCTTLSISPLKDSQVINRLGYQVAEEYSVKWLPSDFKKKEGYKRSIELSREYNLYRQNFCGCAFSKEVGERE